MAATPDAIGYSEDEASDSYAEWCVDAKATNWRMIDKTGSDDSDKYGEEGTDQVPIGHLFQAQCQMAVMGFHRCDFPVLVDGRELRIYRVDRNEDLIKQIALAECELVERIMNADPPEPNWQHEGTLNVIRGMFGTEIGKVAQLSEADHDLWTRREQLKTVAKMIEEESKEIDSRLAWAMQDAEVGRFPDATIELKKITVGKAVVPSYVRKPYSYLRSRKF
jgi:predicted phage-related endonuclease